jgi:CubicO group peptidase (beta-lactamase class C family)
MTARFFLLSLFFSLSLANVSAQHYTSVNEGKYLKNWYVAGPLKVDTAKSPSANIQESFFNRKDDQHLNVSFSLPAHGKKPDLKNWKVIKSTTDIIDFDSIFNRADFASAYAYAEVEAVQPGVALLGVGSDDGVKVWHNGKLVHKNWIARAIQPDNDIVEIPLVKGKNEILVEVQDGEGGWGFTARFLDKKGISNRLIKASSSGDVEEVKRLLTAGADVNMKGENKLSAIDAARINGREEVITLLQAKGAVAGEVSSADVLVDGLYEKLKGKDNPGIAVLVSQDGNIVYKKAFGYADIAHKTPITPLTKFRIGSITKQFIASAILKLQEEGKISVKDKLAKFFPDFPRGDEVTIHHLLTHTSGIHSFTNKDSFLVDVIKPVTNEQLYNYFKNDTYDFNPGTRYMYNNSGYFLLGYIIEKITGAHYGEYLKKTFFDPLGMTNTGVHTPSLKLTNEALGYQKQTSGYDRSLNWNMDWAGGAGSLYSTVEDLHKWNEGLFNNKVLKEESMKAAFTPVLLNNGQEPAGMKYGYGWGISEYRGVKSLGHSGGLHGFISQLMRVTDKKMNIVLLTNVMPPEVEIDPTKLAELYLWKGMAKQASFAKSAVEEKDNEKYTGRYDLSGGMVMTITREADGLYAQVSGQAKHPIYQSSPGHYFWKVVEATVHFVTDADGKVTHGNFEQGSFKVSAPRLADIEYTTVDPAVFEQYKGTYKLREGTNIEITARDGKLYGQATGDALYQLQPLSDTAYHVKELNATLTFKKDTSGKVNSVHVKFAGDSRDAPRIR